MTPREVLVAWDRAVDAYRLADVPGVSAFGGEWLAYMNACTPLLWGLYDLDTRLVGTVQLPLSVANGWKS